MKTLALLLLIGCGNSSPPVLGDNGGKVPTPNGVNSGSTSDAATVSSGAGIVSDASPVCLTTFAWAEHNQPNGTYTATSLDDAGCIQISTITFNQGQVSLDIPNATFLHKD